MQFSMRGAALLMLAISLSVLPGIALAQTVRPATPSPVVTNQVTPSVQPVHTPKPAPSPAVTTVESDMPLCSEITETLPSDVSVVNVTCKSEIGLACVNSISFYGASISCSNVFVKPPETPLPTPTN